MIFNMELYCHIFILWILIWILCIQEHEFCRFGPRPNCGFPCRCSGANRCDPDTGTCLDGSQCQNVLPDGYGWQGPGCRIGNVAYAKPNTAQSGAYLYYKADLAVDGDTTPYITNAQGESCAHPLTYTEPYAWWWVDLEDNFTIQNITLVNWVPAPGFAHRPRFQARSTDYDIKLGNTSDRAQQTLCFHQGKPADKVQPIETITCVTDDMVGRYVSFTRIGGQDPNQAAICEFIVMGYKTIEWHETDCAGACDSVTGCERCVAGKKLPDCREVCPDGYWGVNCANTCGMCTDGIVCDKVTGSCGDQCKGWFIPQLCAKPLMVPPEPLNVAVSNITSASAILLWDRSYGVDLSTRQYYYYIVQYRRKDVNNDDWFTSEQILLSNEHSFRYTLLGLVFNTKYEVQIVPYRALNGLTEAGIIEITEFKTLCVVPDTPPIPHLHGTPDRFTITWEALESILPGCDRLESVAVIIICANSADIMLNATYDILISTNALTHGITDARSCSVVLSVTNNAGFSSASAKTSVSTTTSTETNSLGETEQPCTASGPNITAIVLGSVAGVVIIILVVVIIVLALRIHRNMPPPGGAKTDIDTAGKLNPVYVNAMDRENDVIKPNINPTVVYASVEDTHKATAKVEVSPSGLYENTKGPESQYASLDDSHKNTTKPSSVYQELK